jgi:hypothetical protein
LRETSRALGERDPVAGFGQPLASEQTNRRRGDSVKAGASLREGKPWRGKHPRELRARL